jgi:superfamily II DNA helicase RecQ
VCFTEVLLTISAIIRKLDGLDETVYLLTVFCVGKFNGGFPTLPDVSRIADYAYKDVVSRLHMINSDRNDKGLPRTAEEKKRQIEVIRAVAQYCSNEVDCRRSLILTHFNERFDPHLCAKGCDNCSKSGMIVRQLYTSEAQQAIRLFGQMGVSMDRIPVGHFKDVFAGRNKARVRDSGHDQLSLFGVGKSVDGDRIVGVMMEADIFAIAREASASGWTNDYLKVLESHSIVSYVI